MEETPSGMEFHTDWDMDPSTRPLVANQFLLSAGLPTSAGVPSEFYLTLGHANPPIVLPTPAGLRTNVEDGAVPVEVLGHFAMSRERLIELRDTLTQWIEGWSTQATDASHS